MHSFTNPLSLALLFLEFTVMFHASSYILHNLVEGQGNYEENKKECCMVKIPKEAKCIHKVFSLLNFVHILSFVDFVEEYWTVSELPEACTKHKHWSK